jgi:hypothetical protein
VALGAVFLGIAAAGIAVIIHEAVMSPQTYGATGLMWALSGVAVCASIGIGLVLRTDRLLKRSDGTFSMRTWRIVVPQSEDLDRPEVYIGYVRASGGLFDSDNRERHACGAAVVIHDTRRGFIIAMGLSQETLMMVATDLRDRFGLRISPHEPAFMFEVW